MSVEKRKEWWSAPLGCVVWFLITLLAMTLRKRIRIAGPADSSKIGDYQSIIALWHNRVLIPCYVYRFVLHGKTEMSMLTSASRDGALLSTVASLYGMRTVRGSSHRRGVAGFRDMLDEVDKGCSMCITPDGPRGPLYKCRPGVVKLASMSGLPIIPLQVQCRSCWRIRKAWDGFIIPKPFSRVEFIWGEPIHVPGHLTDEQIKEYCSCVEAALSGGVPDFEPFEEN